MIIEKARGMPWVWGATPDDAAVRYGCDSFAGEHDIRVLRAVTTTAAAADCFLWVCQLRRAPYSYDLIDNFGRRSPRTPREDLTDLRVGQTFMTIFGLIDFEPGRSVTLRMKRGWPERTFGSIALSYAVLPMPDGTARLVSAMVMPRVGRHFAESRRRALAWADLVMMRKQLRVLARLAEGRTRTVPPRDR